MFVTNRTLRVRPEEGDHTIAVLVGGHEAQRDAHRSRHHAVHNRQRGLVDARARKALVVANLLRDLLLRQAQRAVRRARVAVPARAQLHLTLPLRSHVNPRGSCRLLHLGERHVLALGRLCRSAAEFAPTHIHCDDRSLRAVVIAMVVSIDLQHGAAVAVAKRLQLSVPIRDIWPRMPQVMGHDHGVLVDGGRTADTLQRFKAKLQTRNTQEIGSSVFEAARRGGGQSVIARLRHGLENAASSVVHLV